MSKICADVGVGCVSVGSKSVDGADCAAAVGIVDAVAVDCLIVLGCCCCVAVLGTKCTRVCFCHG